MKKSIVASLAAVTAMLCFTGCGSKYTGEWECIALKKDNGWTLKGKKFKDQSGYDISEHIQIEFEDDATGVITYRLWEDEKSEVGFDWAEDGDKVTIYLEKKADFDTNELKAEINDDELELSGFHDEGFSFILKKVDD